MSKNKILFNKVAEEWLNSIEKYLKYSTYVKYRTVYRKYIKNNFKDYDITSLNEEHLQDELLKIYEDIYASSSLCKSINCVLNQILDYGRRYYHIPFIKLSCEKQKRKNRNIDVLNKTEQASLIKQLYKGMDADKLGIVICLATGLRLGEICALRWEDIDMKEKLIHVKRSVQRIEVDGYKSKTRLIEDTPKSELSKREIPVSDSLIKLILPYYSLGGYVIKYNGPMEPRTYQNHFHKYLKEAGVKQKNFHILRHTFATNCINNGTDIKSLSEILGHSDVRITLNRYVHPSLEVKREQMNSLFSTYTEYLSI